MCLHRAPALADEVIRSIEFAPSVMHIAHRILQNIGDKDFNALHLRVEDDMREKPKADPAAVRKVAGPAQA